jgi:MoxR-like ATPase
MTFNTHYAGMEIPVCHIQLERVLQAGIDRVILIGPPGTGKTYSGLTVGVEEGNSYRLVCTEDMTTAEVSGMFLPSSDGFEWKDGVATKAWRTGGRLVVDEIDKASGDVFALLLAYTDSVASASIDLPNGETIRPKPGFSVVMTSNIEDANELPPALRDRFPIAITIDAAHPAALMDLSPELRGIAAQIVAAPVGRRASLRAFHALEKLLKGGWHMLEATNFIFGTMLAESINDALRVSMIENSSVTFQVTSSQPMDTFHSLTLDTDSSGY